MRVIRRYEPDIGAQVRALAALLEYRTNETLLEDQRGTCKTAVPVHRGAPWGDVAGMAYRSSELNSGGRDA